MQEGRQTGRQTDRQTDWQAGRQAGQDKVRNITMSSESGELKIYVPKGLVTSGYHVVMNRCTPTLITEEF